MDPRAVEMWRSLRDRWAASPVRGQRQGHPVDSPGAAHRLPPPLPTDCPTFPTFPPLAACGRNLRRNFDFFSIPSPGRSAPARFACQPLPLPNRDGRGSRPEWPGEPRRGAPGGSKGRPTAGQGGGRPRPLGGSDHPPLGGFWRGRGSRPKGGGTPSGGAPRSVFDRAKNAALIDLRERKPGILKNQ